jgi:hypothetical protein
MGSRWSLMWFFNILEKGSASLRLTQWGTAFVVCTGSVKGSAGFEA